MTQEGFGVGLASQGSSDLVSSLTAKLTSDVYGCGQALVYENGVLLKMSDDFVQFSS